MVRFEDFSKSYYVGELDVIEFNGQHPTIAAPVHDTLRDKLDYEGNDPLVMKIGSTHFAVHSERTIPNDNLALPENIADALNRSLPNTVPIYLAKPEQAQTLLSYQSGLPGAGY